MNDNIQTISQSHIKLALNDKNCEVINVLKSMDIEAIEDFDTRIICRTLLHSYDTLMQVLQHHEEIDKLAFSN